MARKILIGLGVGVCAGVLDVIPMVLQQLSWDANLSAFCMWVVIGFMIATSALRLPGAVKGLLLSFITILPCAVLIGWKEPFTLLPVAGMTAVLGALSGLVIGALTREKA